VLAITALVPSTGVAAAAAHPGSPLYGIHRALLGPTADDPAVPARLLDRAEHLVRVAAVEDPPHAATHVAAAWDLVDQARRRLPHLHASDASALGDRADRVARHLGAVSRASQPGDPAAGAGCARPVVHGVAAAVSRASAPASAVSTTVTPARHTSHRSLTFARHHRRHHRHRAGERLTLHHLDDAACT
jgi:hypothetical protein